MVYFTVAECVDCFLCYQDFATYVAVRSFRQTGCGTGGNLRSVGYFCVALSSNFSLCYSNFATDGAVFAFRQTGCGTSRCYCCVGYFGMAESIDYFLLHQYFVTYGAMLTFCKTGSRTSRSLRRVGYFCVALSSNFSLCYQSFFTYRAMRAFRKSGCGTSRCDRIVDYCGVTLGIDCRLCYQNRITDGAVFAFRQTGCGTGRCDCCVDYFGVTEGIDYCLGYQNFAAYRAVLTFCKSGCGTGRCDCCVDYFGVAKGINYCLGYQNFAAYRAVLTFRQTGCGTGRRLGLISHFLVAEGVDYSLCHEHMTAHRTMRSFCQTGVYTIRRNCCVNYRGMAGGINRFLCYQDCVTYGAMLTFLKSGFGTGGCNCRVGYYGVALSILHFDIRHVCKILSCFIIFARIKGGMAISAGHKNISIDRACCRNDLKIAVPVSLGGNLLPGCKNVTAHGTFLSIGPTGGCTCSRLTGNHLGRMRLTHGRTADITMLVTVFVLMAGSLNYRFVRVSAHRTGVYSRTGSDAIFGKSFCSKICMNTFLHHILAFRIRRSNILRCQIITDIGGIRTAGNGGDSGSGKYITGRIFCILAGYLEFAAFDCQRSFKSVYVTVIGLELTAFNGGFAPAADQIITLQCDKFTVFDDQFCGRLYTDTQSIGDLERAGFDGQFALNQDRIIVQGIRNFQGNTLEIPNHFFTLDNDSLKSYDCVARLGSIYCRIQRRIIVCSDLGCSRITASVLTNASQVIFTEIMAGSGELFVGGIAAARTGHVCVPTVFGTGGSFRLVAHFSVAEGCNGFLCYQDFAAFGAVLAFRQTGGRTGGCDCLIDHFGVTEGISVCCIAFFTSLRCGTCCIRIIVNAYIRRSANIAGVITVIRRIGALRHYTSASVTVVVLGFIRMRHFLEYCVIGRCLLCRRNGNDRSVLFQSPALKDVVGVGGMCLGGGAFIRGSATVSNCSRFYNSAIHIPVNLNRLKRTARTFSVHIRVSFCRVGYCATALMYLFVGGSIFRICVFSTVALSINYFLCYQGFVTYRAMRTFRQTGGRTGRGLRCVDHFLVAECDFFYIRGVVTT